MRRALLTTAELKDALTGLKGWKVSKKRLTRAYDFTTYSAGLDFAVRLGSKADAMNHHPDLEIGYRRVTVRWTTHDAGGLTRFDLLGARVTDELAQGLA